MRNATLRRQPGSKRLPVRLRSLGFVAIASAAALLGLLHLWLLGERLAAGDFADPRVALRWAAAAALVGGLAVLRRRGVRLLWGRQALGFWVLVLLLHWSAAGPAAEARSGRTRGVAEQVVVLLPPAGALGVLLLGALALARASGGLGHQTGLPLRGRAHAPRVWGFASAVLRAAPLAPRPPPTLA